ncbi:hypothetical protein Q0N61_08805 [Corynebacterium sanguinis]|uniref:hypothetical protein n=1 Tax=Corynebacterium sanguinis TaxID=2594913 RepID=UPI00223C530B|nr:hypothetical protein [Corynebacterium sanguinis]MCT1425088.1 hypothetical protein [Corynebacterium sanguinis]MCT1555804.1 hypothetical protein [Corynebacterium sanguinis]MCT1664446.1 hypothetical protein [Corynebacterium sanguinis]MDN8622872.1 hypothetical protein [Corynebacterium sanguinis]
MSSCFPKASLVIALWAVVGVATLISILLGTSALGTLSLIGPWATIAFVVTIVNMRDSRQQELLDS